MKRIFCVLLLVVLALPLVPARAEEGGLEEYFDSLNIDTRDDGKVFTIMDQEGNVLVRTGRFVHAGDTWIGMDNRKWEVYQVAGDNAYAQLLKSPKKDQSLFRRYLVFIIRLIPGIAPAQQQDNVQKRIGIYNTHGAEAYVPNDGTDSVPQGGGVIDVADSLKEGLENQGVQVVQSKETHVPHDAGAYKRSRNTVAEIMNDGVDAVIDVHRDAVPKEEYLENDMVQIQLVVGRQNQNQAANQQFAEGLKAVADEKYPGLVKGIFSAKGNYNQDMAPTSMLIEVGSHENDKAMAEQSVVMFADVLSTYLYGSPEQAPASPETKGGGSTAWRTILWLLAIAVVGGGIYLYISAGSWPEMKRKLQDFARGEFGDLFKLRLKNRGGDDEPK